MSDPVLTHLQQQGIEGAGAELAAARVRQRIGPATSYCSTMSYCCQAPLRFVPGCFSCWYQCSKCGMPIQERP